MKQIVGVFKGSNIVHNYGVHFCFESQVSHWQPITNDFRTSISFSCVRDLCLCQCRDLCLSVTNVYVNSVTYADGPVHIIRFEKTRCPSFCLCCALQKNRTKPRPARHHYYRSFQRGCTYFNGTTEKIDSASGAGTHWSVSFWRIAKISRFTI